jgi:hypothetical protein
MMGWVFEHWDLIRHSSFWFRHSRQGGFLIPEGRFPHSRQAGQIF